MPGGCSHLDYLHAFLFVLDKLRHSKTRIDILQGAVVEQRSTNNWNSETEGSTRGANLSSVGYMGRGFHTARLAWAKLEPVFTVGGVVNKEAITSGTIYTTIERSPDTL